MRQTSLTKPTIASRQTSRRQRRGPQITPVKGFFTTLLCLGVPTLTLGAVCLSLIQNNLRLSQENEELQSIASEVKEEVDSLGEEIESLRERAGVPKASDADADLQSELQGDLQSELEVDEISAQGSSRWSDSVTRTMTDDGVTESNTQSVNALPPRGGPANTVDPVGLLLAVQKQVPKLNATLDSSVKPALERALAEEAAYPTGQPVVGIVEVSSEFGLRGNPFGGSGREMHEGIDFVGAHGDIIAAAGDGVITLAGPNGGYGNTVTIDHDYGYETLYAHMSDVKVKVGDVVKRGQIIGLVGSTGRSSGPHLHYSIYHNEKAINPRNLLKLPENNMAQGPR